MHYLLRATSKCLENVPILKMGAHLSGGGKKGVH